MKTIIIVGLIIMTAFGCNQKTGGSLKATMDCDPYFVFDKVEHYSIKIKEDTIWTLNDKEIRTADEHKLLKLLTLDSLNHIADTSQFADIESFGYQKKMYPMKSINRFQNSFAKEFTMN